MIVLVGFRLAKSRPMPTSPQFARLCRRVFHRPLSLCPMAHPFNQVLLLLPAVLVIRDWRDPSPHRPPHFCAFA